jgi:hypothetical protein
MPKSPEEIIKAIAESADYIAYLNLLSREELLAGLENDIEIFNKICKKKHD